MLQELLCQEQLQHLPPADVASLLTTCLMECPDRECAVSLVKLITLTLTTSVQASPTVQQAPAWNTASGSRASSHRRLPQGDETKAYVLVSALLVADLHRCGMSGLATCFPCSTYVWPAAVDNKSGRCIL